jgi:hypothetical protein
LRRANVDFLFQHLNQKSNGLSKPFCYNCGEHGHHGSRCSGTELEESIVSWGMKICPLLESMTTRVLYTLPHRKYLMACVLTVFPFFYWRVLMAYVFSDYSGTVKCRISAFWAKWAVKNHSRWKVRILLKFLRNLIYSL